MTSPFKQGFYELSGHIYHLFSFSPLLLSEALNVDKQKYIEIILVFSHKTSHIK